MFSSGFFWVILDIKFILINKIYFNLLAKTCMWPFSSVMLNALWRFLCPYVGNKLWVMGHWVCSVVCVMFPSSIMFCSGNYG